MKENRQYYEMMSAAIRRMRDVDIPAAAERSGMIFDRSSGHISFLSFGENTIIDTATLQAVVPIGMWQHLAILQYLETADGSRPTDR